MTIEKRLRELVREMRTEAKETHESTVWQRREGHVSEEEYMIAGTRMVQLNEDADKIEKLLADAPAQFPCDCQSFPHHFQCNHLRQAYTTKATPAPSAEKE